MVPALFAYSINERNVCALPCCWRNELSSASFSKRIAVTVRSDDSHAMNCWKSLFVLNRHKVAHISSFGLLIMRAVCPYSLDAFYNGAFK